LTERLDATAWPAVASVAADRLLLIPLGSTEQHGPHLTFTTDTEIAAALVDALAARRDDVTVAPPLAYGSSGEHAAFAGTLSIGGAALQQVVVELVRSADAFAGVVLVCAHGGNAEPLSAAVTVLGQEGRRVLSWTPSIRGGDAHAGRTETSVMLALRPGSVTMTAAETGDTRRLDVLLPRLRADGVAAVAANGVLGDPTGASAEEGAAIFDAWVEDLDEAVRRWRN
jgi:creatinine amidohydrolase